MEQSNLQVLKTQSPATVEGVQMILGTEGQIDESIVERIKFIAKEFKKLAKSQKLIQMEKVYMSVTIACDPNTLAYCVKYYAFDKPEVWCSKLKSVLHFTFEGSDFRGLIRLETPFDIEIE